MEPLIDIKMLTVGHTNSILTGLNLSVVSNEIIVVIGENGAGKSTLIKTIAGILTPKQGTLLMEGKPQSDWKLEEIAKFQSYVSAKGLPELMMKVKEFVAFGRYPYMNWLAQPSAKDLSLISTSINNCNIGHLQEKLIGALSDGEKQKVMLARAFAQETKVLLLDEPTTHLDIRNSNAMFKLIEKSKTEWKKSVVFSSHQVEKAITIADKIWLVHNGRVEQLSVSEFQESKKWRQVVFGDELD